ncbi:MAG: transposase [Clostridiales bacterium]|jgi:transposase-like protein|nr:transposase [Clostridiales bacterium]
MVNRREYTPEYKAKIALEMLREESTASEIASREQINVKQLYNWRTDLVENAYRIFAGKREEKEVAKKQREFEEHEQELMAKVGQLTLENDWLKKKSAEYLVYRRETKSGRR